MTCVIDASIAIGWTFKDKYTPFLQRLERQVAKQGAVVPALWHLEVANVILQGENRGRIAPADSLAQLNLLRALPIEVDHETLVRAWAETFALARTQRLTLYDAAYLELAARRALPLASLDEDLTAAAKKIGVAVLI